MVAGASKIASTACRSFNVALFKRADVTEALVKAEIVPIYL